jgi:hypothetical protein
MLRYIINHALFPPKPLTLFQRHAIDIIEASESILYVSECRVVSRSLIGNYVYRSLRFKDAAKVVVATWVTFENRICLPWLAVLLRPKILVLCAPDGSQIEVALPFHVDSIWPVSLNREGIEGLIFQQLGAAAISTHISVFSMTHPLHDLCPIGELNCTDDDGYSAKLSCDTSEQIIFVSKSIPPLVVTYSVLRQRHALWYLLVQGGLPAGDYELHDNNDASSVFSRDVSSELPFARMPEFLYRRLRVLSGSKVLRTSNPAIRVFHVTDNKDGSLLCLVLSGNSSKVASSNCASADSLVCIYFNHFIVIVLNRCSNNNYSLTQVNCVASG